MWYECWRLFWASRLKLLHPAKLHIIAGFSSVFSLPFRILGLSFKIPDELSQKEDLSLSGGAS